MQSKWFQRIGVLAACLVGAQLAASVFADNQQDQFPPPGAMPPGMEMPEGMPPMGGMMPEIDEETQKEMEALSQAMDEKYNAYKKSYKEYSDSTKKLIEAAKSLDPSDADSVKKVVELAKKAAKAEAKSAEARQACRETTDEMNATAKKVLEQMGVPAGMIPSMPADKMFPEEGIPFDVQSLNEIMPGGCPPGAGCPPMMPPQGQPPMPGNREA